MSQLSESIWILEKRRVGAEEWGVDYQTAPKASLRDAERLGLEHVEPWSRFEFRWTRYAPITAPAQGGPK